MYEPVVSINYQNINSTYMSDRTKQRIVSESSSRAGFHAAFVHEWQNHCADLNICSDFHDLSGFFQHTSAPIFIDYHVGPEGNKLMAERLSQLIK